MLLLVQGLFSYSTKVAHKNIVCVLCFPMFVIVCDFWKRDTVAIRFSSANRNRFLVAKEFRYQVLYAVVVLQLIEPSRLPGVVAYM